MLGGRVDTDRAVASTPAKPLSILGSLAMSAEGIYGLIIVAGLIVVSRNLTGRSIDALISVVATLLVFFAAHVYAVAVSWLGADGKNQGVWQAVRHGVRHSAGLLLVGVIPIIVLSLGVFGLIRATDAVWMALAADIILLGVLGWFIAATRTRSVWARLGSVMLTAAFGGILIALKVLVHH